MILYDSCTWVGLCVSVHSWHFVIVDVTSIVDSVFEINGYMDPETVVAPIVDGNDTVVVETLQFTCGQLKYRYDDIGVKERTNTIRTVIELLPVETEELDKSKESDIVADGKDCAIDAKDCSVDGPPVHLWHGILTVDVSTIVEMGRVTT